MPRFMIERHIPGAGDLSPDDLRAIAIRSCDVLRGMPAVQWVQSYVTDDRITCVYIAPDEESVREHARRGGFPADQVLGVRTIIDPMTSEPATMEPDAATPSRGETRAMEAAR